jgi:enoyl-[acyl-carrier protein] reductase I
MTEPASLMKGKKGLVMGVANDRSIAWGITKAVVDQGAEVAFTYQNEVLEKRVRPLAEGLGSDILIECDVSDDRSIEKVFETLGEKWGAIDFVIHAIAFSDKNELTGRYLDTSAQNFTQTMAISCYSFTSVCRAAQPLMNKGGSIVTLTYAGSELVPHYNVMGVAKAALECSVRYLAVDLGKEHIRVNAISAGPIRTLAASGIGDFRYILKWNELNAPLKRNVTIDDVGGAGLYLLSDLSKGVTGEVHHVDCGYNVVGMKAVDAPDISVVTGD